LDVTNWGFSYEGFAAGGYAGAGGPYQLQQYKEGALMRDLRRMGERVRGSVPTKSLRRPFVRSRVLRRGAVLLGGETHHIEGEIEPGECLGHGSKYSDFLAGDGLSISGKHARQSEL